MNIEQINGKIWDIDNEDKILDYKLSNGISYWLILRYQLFTQLVTGHAQVSSASTQSSGGFTHKIKNKVAYLKYKQLIQKHNPLKVKKHYDCLNFCSSVGTVKGKDGFKSRISAVLTDLKEVNTLQVISSNKMKYHPKYEGEYCYFDALLLEKLPEKKIAKSPDSETQMQEIEAFVELLKKHLDKYLGSEIWNSMAKNLVSCQNKVMQLEGAFSQFFDQTKPKLIFIEDGNYGSLENCTLIKLAKDRQIITAEIQHGVFDIAFQYSDKLIKNPAFAVHKTDQVLTYGEYFTRFIRSSSNNIHIGSYFLEEKQKQIAYSKSRVPAILFITQLRYTDGIIPILHKALKKQKTPFKLIVRLHPADKGNKTHFKLLEEFKGVEFSVQQDVYEQLGNADFVIGSFSTLLFESIYFKKVPFIYKNDFSDFYIPAELGVRFSNAEELHQILQNPAKKNVTDQSMNYYWSLDCRSKFRKWISELGVVTDFSRQKNLKSVP